MLTASDEQVASSIRRLDPVDRTLLDLSVHRGVDDEIIADVLHVDRVEIARRRDLVLEAVADYLGLIGQDERSRLLGMLEALPENRWREQAQLQPGPARRRRGRWPLAVAVIALLAIVAGIAALVAAGGGDEGGRPARAQAGGVALAPVTPGGHGTGTAKVTGRKLRLRVAGLPSREEPYEVWLYNSVTDAVPLGQRVGGDFDITLRLPSAVRRYRFIDISREPLDGNPNHSGASVLRVPTDRLLRPSSARR